MSTLWKRICETKTSDTEELCVGVTVMLTYLALAVAVVSRLRGDQKLFEIAIGFSALFFYPGVAILMSPALATYKTIKTILKKVRGLF